MTHIVFIGPPGSGKGTQSRALASKLGLPHVSTGELLRELIAQGNGLSRWLAERLDRGHFAPDYLAMRMVLDRLESEFSSGCILDGFPRTVEQAKSVDEHFAGSNASIDLVFELQVPPELLVERLVLRATEQNRPDDSLASIGERMKVYELQTAPAVGYYRQAGRLVEIDGTGSPNEVSLEIGQVVRDKLSLQRNC